MTRICRRGCVVDLQGICDATLEQWRDAFRNGLDPLTDDGQRFLNGIARGSVQDALVLVEFAQFMRRRSA